MARGSRVKRLSGRGATREVGLVVRSGPARVVEHGTTTTFGGYPLLLMLELPEDNFVVEVCFEQHDGEPVGVAPEETDVGLRLRCINFDGAEGKGSAVPVLLGELGDDLVFFHFRAWLYGRTNDHTVHYTFYRVAKDAIGWRPATAGEPG